LNDLALAGAEFLGAFSEAVSRVQIARRPLRTTLPTEQLTPGERIQGGTRYHFAHNG
jgi:hypothetical protein